MADELKTESRNERLIRVIPKKDLNYEKDIPWIPASSIDDVHSTDELVRFAENDERVDIEARVLCATQDGLKHKKLNKKEFIEAVKSDKASKLSFREFDSFGMENSFQGNALVGDDYIPLLGGPFNKQQYMTDYLRQHATAFHAHTHDPVAKRVVSMIRQFVLGKGFRIDVVGGRDKDAGEIYIKALEKVNDLQELMGFACTELSIYGETMVWKIPGNTDRIVYNPRPGDDIKKALLPRFRLIDPSVIWEIVGYPEDPSGKGVLYYQWIAPTQYQIYTDGKQPTLKFIIQQVPGDQVYHYKINTVSNEKRGRSDLFPILGYLKRLRDSINYQIIADQKAAAWAIDTTVIGSQTDIDAYVADQQALGTIAPAGSEFVHTDKIKREYLANQASARGQSSSFDWCMDMIAMGSGIPTSYFGMHKSSGQNRASALVGTEPVTKFFEERQNLLEKILRDIIDGCLEKMGYDVDYEITFPELITADRTTKIKDIIMCEQSGFISKERAATIIAKELNITEYDYNQEMIDIKVQGEDMPQEPSNPLTFDDQSKQPTAMNNEKRTELKQQLGT